jgi:hypothetical protein
MLLEGDASPLLPLDKLSREADNEFVIDRGNHKSTSIHEVESTRLLIDVPNCKLAPGGIVEQGTIYDTGRLVKKHRVTHDQCCPVPSKVSVKRRVIDYQLMKCMFGFYLLRIIHYIIII